MLTSIPGTAQTPVAETIRKISTRNARARAMVKMRVLVDARADTEVTGAPKEDALAS